MPVLQTYKAAGVVADSSPNAAGLLTGATIEGPVLDAADVILAIGLDAVELIPASWPYAAPVVALSGWPEDSPYYEPAIEVVGPLSELIGGLRSPDGWLGRVVCAASPRSGFGRTGRRTDLAVRAGAVGCRQSSTRDRATGLRRDCRRRRSHARRDAVVVSR